jgi:branched-chain amino acid transport system permease protein
VSAKELGAARRFFEIFKATKKMFYRENGQYKTSYRADQQIFAIAQDRWAILALIAAAFLIVPMLGSDYMFRAIFIPFLIMSLAALGVNILVGYCGQISLGSGAFMAVGAYAAFNFFVRVPGIPLLLALVLGGLCSSAFGILFGLPSLRVKGLYLAVATLAAQFFSDWMFLRIKWFTNDAPSGSVSVSGLQVLGLPIESPISKYILCLAILVVMALLAKNLVRGAVGREWMAIRDMDVAAAVIGIRPMYAKLSAFAVSSFIVGVAGALWGFVYLGAWEPAAFSVDMSFKMLFMVIIGGMGSIMGSFFGAGFIVLLPIFLNQFLPVLGSLFGVEISTAGISHSELIIFGALIVWFLIVEPHGLAKLWALSKQKLRLWPFPH